MGVTRRCRGLLAAVVLVLAGGGTASAAVPAEGPDPLYAPVCLALQVPGGVVFLLTDTNGLYEPGQDALEAVNRPFGCYDD